MTDLITGIWAGLKDAGMPDVMLYLSDGTACRCHWDETALIGTIRVALLADQERKIVRIVPVHECKGIGVASPKGTDPAGYRAVVQSRLKEQTPADPIPLLPVVSPAIHWAVSWHHSRAPGCVPASFLCLPSFVLPRADGTGRA